MGVNWHGWVSGSAATTILAVGQQLDWWKPDQRTYLWLIALGLLVSIFQAWRVLHRKVEDLAKPKFVVNVHGAASYIRRDGATTLCVLAIRITNHGADSAIAGWAVRYATTNGSKGHAQVGILDGDLHVTLPEGAAVFGANEMLSRRTGLLVRGDSWAGRLPCIFRGDCVKTITDGSLAIEVCATDYLGKEHWSPTWRGAGQISQPMFMSGEPISQIRHAPAVEPKRDAGFVNRRPKKKNRRR